MGDAYHGGYGVQRDGAEAIKWWLKAAEKGDFNADRQLARAYRVGDGVPRSEATATKWDRKSHVDSLRPENGWDSQFDDGHGSKISPQ